MTSKTYLFVAVRFGHGLGYLDRLRAVQAMAWEAQCIHGGKPSLGRWLQHIADLKIQADETSQDFDLMLVTRPPDESAISPPPPDPHHTFFSVSLGPGPEGARRKRVLLDLAAEIPDQPGNRPPTVSRLANYLAHLRLIHEGVCQPVVQPPSPEKPPRFDWTSVGSDTPLEIRSRYAELLKAKELRDRKLWSHAMVAEVTGLSCDTVRLQTMGAPIRRIHDHVLDALCAFFECDVGDLLYVAEVDS